MRAVTNRFNLLCSINSSQISMNLYVLPDCQTNNKQTPIQLPIVITSKDPKPYSNIESASRIKKPKDVTSICTNENKMILFADLIVHWLLWFSWGGSMPMIWWNFWTNWKSFIDLTMLRIENKLSDVDHEVRKFIGIHVDMTTKYILFGLGTTSFRFEFQLSRI